MADEEGCECYECVCAERDAIKEQSDSLKAEVERLRKGLCVFIAIDERLGKSGDVFAKARALAMRALLDGISERASLK